MQTSSALETYVRISSKCALDASQALNFSFHKVIIKRLHKMRKVPEDFSWHPWFAWVLPEGTSIIFTLPLRRWHTPNWKFSSSSWSTCSLYDKINIQKCTRDNQNTFRAVFSHSKVSFSSWKKTIQIWKFETIGIPYTQFGAIVDQCILFCLKHKSWSWHVVCNPPQASSADSSICLKEATTGAEEERQF